MSSTIAMEFRILGPVEIRAAGRVLDAGHARQRAVLAVLLLDLGRVVSADRLIDRVWGDNPPAAVRNVLYGYIARIRAALSGAADDGVALRRGQGGYVLHADPQLVDLYRFRELAGRAKAAGDSAEELLREALSLWRGPALAGLDSPWLNAMRHTLELERDAAQLDLNDVRLRQGQHAALTADLARQAAASPADERLVGQLMLALYRSGRQAEALHWFEQTRRHLADELGTDPGPTLRELHQQILAADPGLRLAATVSGPAVPVPRELPADVAAFTGRAAELAALDDLLLGTPSTTAAVISAVSGTAGVGKTALAVHWAHHAAGHFPDGQLHVNLRGYDPDRPMAATDALAGFLRSLGVPGQQIPPEESDRITRYRSLLAGRQILIVLDNAATVDQVRPLLPGHPDCRVLVTSRDSLAGLVARDGAKRIDLDLLPLDEAVALLRELIGDRADGEPAAVITLAGQCARLPLALRVAAELAAARAATPLDELVGELRDQQRRLDLLHADGDPRTAVRAVFSWSYDRLDAAAARAFRLAALHPGSDFEPYALAALTARTHDQARAAFDILTRAHLVQHASAGRYLMHDLLRAYARELAADIDGEQESRAALTRLFDHYLWAAATAMDTMFPAERHRRPRIPSPPSPSPPLTDPSQARAWLDAERANLVVTATFAADNDWPGHAARISATVFRLLEQGGHLADAVLIHEAARTGARKTGNLSAEAAALTALGAVGWRQGRYRQAFDHHQLALTLFRSAGDRAGQARALLNLGMVEEMQGSYSEALRHHRQSMALYRQIGDQTGEARALNALGSVADALGDYGQAATHFQRALALYRESGDKTGEAGALCNLGMIDERIGRYEQAARHSQQALALFRQVGEQRGEAFALSNLGQIDYQLGRYGQAAERHRKSIEIHRAIGEPASEAKARNGLGKALLADGRPSDAEREHAMALRLACQIGHQRHKASAHDGLARCYRSTGELGLAREHWGQALALFTELGSRDADQVRGEIEALGT